MLQQISVFVENKTGRLCAIMETLAAAQINIRALTIADTADFGIVRLIVGDVGKAATALHEKDFTIKITEVIAFAIPDRPGAMYDVVKLLGEGDIDIDYSYSLVVGQQKDAELVIKTKDADNAVKILSDAGIRLLTMDDLS